MFNFLRYELGVRRGAILGWGLGVSGFVAVYIAFYPFVPAEMMSMIGDIALYQAMGITDMGNFGGFFASTVLNFLALLATIFALTNATAALAGEEDAGTLELLATLPLARWQMVVLKAVAMSVALLLVLGLAGLVAVVMVYWVSTMVDETIMEPVRAFTLALEAWPITFAFMMFSLWLSAYLPTRRAGLAVATIFVIFSFFGNNLVPLVTELEPIRPLFLYQYYDRSVLSITEGSMSTGDLLVLLGTGLVFLGLAVLSFQRRNLTTGAWPWQRSRADSLPLG